MSETFAEVVVLVSMSKGEPLLRMGGVVSRRGTEAVVVGVVGVVCCVGIMGAELGVATGMVGTGTSEPPAPSVINALILASVFGPTAPIGSMPFCS